MDLKKFENKLSKINSVFAAISEDGKINEIEKDLLKSYIVKLYESLNKLEADEIDIPQEIQAIKKGTEKKRKKAERSMVVEQEKEQENVEEVATVPIIEEPVKIETIVIEEAKEEVEMEDLFADFSGGEVSDKLSQSKIADLTKAWSINEKIFTIKELFAGDSENFRQTIRELNELENFEAARKYLMAGVASSNKWAEGEKFKKARNFIKHIKRRYK